MSAWKINEHHRESHLPIQCDICQKECNTPHSLERHRYSHNMKPYVCDTCNQGFHFASELAGYWIKHSKIKTFICAHAKCGKSFMRNSELTAHSNTHTRVKYKCDCNKYETNDKQLFRQHQKSHSDEKQYACKICGEKFKHITQVHHQVSAKHKNRTP